MVLPYSTERAPLELLLIMPPTVARLAVEMSGAKRSRWGARCAFSSSSTMPGSMRAHRSSGFTSSTRLKNRDVSSCSPSPMACPACDVPPPRAVIDTPCRRAIPMVRSTSSRLRTTTTPVGSIW